MKVFCKDCRYCSTNYYELECVCNSNPKDNWRSPGATRTYCWYKNSTNECEEFAERLSLWTKIRNLFKKG